MSDEDFDRTAQDLFNVLIERHPVLATFLGIHDYDHLLEENSKQFVLEETQIIREFKKEFEAFDPKDLSGGRPLDLNLALYLFDIELFQLEEMRLWESDPGGAEGVGEGLFPLFTREFAPLETRVESITGRLEGTPRYLEEGRTRIVRPVRLWSEMALESAQRFPPFLELIVHTVENKVPRENLESLKKAKKEALNALEDYGKWLQEEVLPDASENCILGEERFSKLVQLRRLGYEVDEIRALGVRYLQESKEALSQIAESIDPAASVEETKDRIRSNHPADFDGVLEAVRKAIQESRSFIVDKRLATLPPRERLRVTETPTFLRAVLPFAAYFPPARYDKVQEGVYIVTPPTNGEELLKEHNYASIRNTAVHEGYPGHHLQLSSANLNPSIVRQLSMGVAAAEMVEGWAHYCEDMMQEMGFSTSPDVRFVQLQDLIWRACRIIIDVDLHCGRMTFDEAVEMLVREAGMEKASAVAEVKRYTQYPTYQLSYLIGKHLIKELRDEVEKRMGDGFSLGLFHDTILYAGSIPFFLLRRAVEDKIAKLEEGVEDLY